LRKRRLVNLELYVGSQELGLAIMKISPLSIDEFR
jgi:hypothetical protein